MIDGNPEAILISTPLDGTKNADDGKLGDKFEVRNQQLLI